MPAQAAPARAGNRNHPTRRLRRIDAPGPIHRGIRAGQPGLPTRSIPFNWPKANLPISRNKRWKTTLWPCSSPESCPANPWTPSTKAGSGQPQSGSHSRNREPRSPISGYLNRTKPSKAAILPCSGASGIRPSLPAMPFPASAGPSVPARRASRRAYKHADRRLRKNTRDPHLPVMRVTMATTLHSGVYPPLGASRWLNRANPPGVHLPSAAQLSPVRKVGSLIAYTIGVKYM